MGQKTAQRKLLQEKTHRSDEANGKSTDHSSCQGSRNELHATIRKELTKESSIFNKIFLVLVCTGLWVFHFKYLNTLFENDRHFSHLADFEREMTYRTEMVSLL